MFSKSILILTALILLVAGEGLALDKRVPVHNPRANQQVVKFNYADTTLETRLYDSLGQPAGTVKNSSRGVKIQYCNALTDKTALVVETTYLLARQQKKTSPTGITSMPLDSSGWSDTTMSLNYQAADSRQGGFGLLLGGEVNLPTGDGKDGLGSGTTDFSLRSTISRKTAIGYPYLAAIYTWSGEDQIDGQTAHSADDLFIGLGLKSRYWDRFAFNARAYLYQLGDSVKINNGVRVVDASHSMPGCRLELFYSFSKKLEAGLLLEQSWPEDYTFTTDGITMLKKLGSRERFGFSLRAIF